MILAFVLRHRLLLITNNETLPPILRVLLGTYSRALFRMILQFRPFPFPPVILMLENPITLFARARHRLLLNLVTIRLSAIPVLGAVTREKCRLQEALTKQRLCFRLRLPCIRVRLSTMEVATTLILWSFPLLLVLGSWIKLFCLAASPAEVRALFVRIRRLPWILGLVLGSRPQILLDSIYSRLFCRVR